MTLGLLAIAFVVGVLIGAVGGRITVPLCAGAVLFGFVGILCIPVGFFLVARVFGWT